MGTNELIHSIDDIPRWMNILFGGKWKQGDIPELWDGKTSERIVKRLCELYN